MERNQHGVLFDPHELAFFHGDSGTNASTLSREPSFAEKITRIQYRYRRLFASLGNNGKFDFALLDIKHSVANRTLCINSLLLSDANYFPPSTHVGKEGLHVESSFGVRYHDLIICPSGLGAFVNQEAFGTPPSPTLRSCFTEASSCFGPPDSDLEITAERPAERASFSTIPPTLFVNINRGTFGKSSFNLRAASSPFITGIDKSRIIKSGCSASALRMP